MLVQKKFLSKSSCPKSVFNLPVINQIMFCCCWISRITRLCGVTLIHCNDQMRILDILELHFSIDISADTDAWRRCVFLIHGIGVIFIDAHGNFEGTALCSVLDDAVTKVSIQLKNVTFKAYRRSTVFEKAMILTCHWIFQSHPDLIYLWCTHLDKYI